MRFSESVEFRSNTAADVLGYSRAGSQADWADDVYRLYQATLGRNPDPTGFDDWTTQLSEGRDYLSVISGFVNSLEFRNTYGNTSSGEFVTLLYNNVLERGPDPTGFANWTALLNTGSLARAEVVSRFAQSAEFRGNSADLFEAWTRDQGGDRLSGGMGDNLLFGGIGSDTFVFDTLDGGEQTTADMEPWDTVEIHNSSFADANALIAALTQADNDVLLNDNGITIHFVNINVSSFDTDMFWLV